MKNELPRLCETCVFRDGKGYCENPKLTESYWHKKEEAMDMLIYDYTEGGGFWVGPQFGCIHHKEKK
jgi:hypothetical protein